MKMNTNKIEKQKKLCRDEWFKDHKATLLDYMYGPRPDPTKPVKVEGIVIDWSKPDSWNYGCRFIIHRRWLIVVGDVGEATYEWGQDLSLEFLAKLDFGYFHGKCRASETGMKFEQWDSREAYDALQQRLKEMSTAPDRDDWKQPLLEITRNTPQDEFVMQMHRAYNEGADPMDISDLIGAGKQPHCRAVAHFVGLQMAIEQLTAKNEDQTKSELPATT